MRASTRASAGDRPVPHVPGLPRSPRRTLAALIASLAALVVLLGSAAPAVADPDGDPDTTVAGRLEELSRAYYDTQAALAQSQQRQAQIKQRLDEVNARLEQLSDQVGKLAAARYQGAGVARASILLVAPKDTKTLLAGVALNDFLVWRDDSLLREYREIKRDATEQEELLDAEVRIQAEQFAQLDTQKREAEKALMAIGGMLSDGFPVVADRKAQPAPRNSAGGFSPEGCTANDPTTKRCITPRTYHMLLEAQQAGFTHYTSCYRDQSWGEHPKGRACDFSANQYGFKNANATGADRTYGDQLASWAVFNASALGILYVIWYRQIWTPTAGWHHYSRVVGDPATDHTNHVHISMY